jgi:hypothetical protein
MSEKYFLIKGKEVKIKVTGPYKNGNGKYTGIIELHSSGKFESVMLDTGPIYTTEKEAANQMEEIAMDIRGCE